LNERREGDVISESKKKKALLLPRKKEGGVGVLSLCRKRGLCQVVRKKEKKREGNLT